MQIGSPTTDRQILPEMNDMCERLGFGSVEECMHPKTLLEFFNYEIPTHMSKFPPCYTHNHANRAHQSSTIAVSFIVVIIQSTLDFHLVAWQNVDKADVGDVKAEFAFELDT